MPIIGTRGNVSASGYGFASSLKPIDPPTFVNHSSSSGTSQTISYTMPTRQAGDLAVVVLNGWSTSTATATNADPSGWTSHSPGYFSASVLANDGNTINNQIGIRRIYSRVMTNTTSDNFSYSLPSSMSWSWLAQYIILRPASGTTYLITAGDRGGQTGNIVGNPVTPPSSSIMVVRSLTQSINPRSALLNFFHLGMAVNAGPNGFLANGTSASYNTSLTSSTTMTRVTNTATGFTAYTSSLTGVNVNGLHAGTFSYSGPTNYWFFNAYAVIDWIRS